MRNLAYPGNILVSRKKILEARDFVKKIRQEEKKAKAEGRTLMRYSEEIDEIRKADYLVKGAIHPDTGEINPIPMRVNSLVFTNLPIVLGFLLSKPTIGYTIFWQFIN